MGNTENIDEEQLRDHAIRHLEKAGRMAYRMMRDPRLDLKTRQTWFRDHRDAVLALNQLLKDREEKDWEKRLARIEEYRKKATSPTWSEASAIEEDNPGTKPQSQA